MDQHPVPKNVLTVEFKLFGSLTVAQFMRILGGGLAALAIFALNINPLISLPLIVVVAGYGVLSALVKDFNIRVNGIIRSLFVSPRYVWKKKEVIPDALIETRKVSASDAAKLQRASSGKEIADISLDRLLDARAASKLSPSDDTRGGSNFDRVYGNEFENTAAAASPVRAQTPQIRTANPNLAGASVSGQAVKIGPNKSVIVQPLAKPTQGSSVPASEVSEKQEIENDQMASLYEQEIQGLQERLSELTKQGAAPEAKQAVIDRINQLYAGVKQAAVRNQPAAEPKKIDPKRMVYGVVVDKVGNPIPTTQVSVFDLQGNQVGPVAISGADGRFAVESEFANGEYVVSLNHPKYQFLRFKIRVGSDKLPAYRFREK